MLLMEYGRLPRESSNFSNFTKFDAEGTAIKQQFNPQISEVIDRCVDIKLKTEIEVTVKIL